MTNSDQKFEMPPIPPEKLVGHDLVNYLIAHPEARGDFKWRPFRSCMWRDLLIAQPGFQDVADFLKIHHRDAFKILMKQPQLAHRFDWKRLWMFWQEECMTLLIKYPQLATPEHTSFLHGYIWGQLLRKQPQLAYLCSFEDMNPHNWVNLVSGQEIFADKCPWHTFRVYNWVELVSRKKSCLKFLKLKYLDSEDALLRILYRCYFGDARAYGGVFGKGVPDVANFLIRKRMDRENGKRYLKKQFGENNWSFVEAVCDISPEEAMDVNGKKYMPFFITLMAADKVFEKLFPLFDLTERDPGGNSLLLAALVHGLCSNSMERYHFLRKQGLDPEEKNLAGFSCVDLERFVKDIKSGKGDKNYVC